MNKEFIPYEQALALKELGFEASSIGGTHQGSVFYYENGELYYDYRPMYSSSAHNGQILAPLYQQAFRWFREKYFHHAFLEPTSDSITENYCFKILDQYSGKGYSKSYVTYEEAELECLKKLIKYVK